MRRYASGGVGVGVMVGVRVGTGVNVDQRHTVRLGVRVIVGVREMVAVRDMVGVSVGVPGWLVVLGVLNAVGVSVAESEAEIDTGEACARLVGKTRLGVLLGSRVGDEVGEIGAGLANKGSAQPARPRNKPRHVIHNNHPDKD
jgi:hypothetical protein